MTTHVKTVQCMIFW